jgi:transcriptional regulator with XRE-family HTH domain
MRETSEVARRFGANLRRVREQAGLSQEEVGLRSSVHRTEVGLLERGERIPRIDTLLKIAAGIGVRIECPLFDGISWAPARAVTRSGAFTLSAASGPGRGDGTDDGEARDV